MELSKFNPFPLNIKPKIDSWEKLQLLQHIDPQLKLTAAELNRILAALQYLYSNVSVSEYVSNVPVQMRGLAVNFKASGSQLQKVANAINSMPNYVINDGNLIFFYTQRIVNSSISDIKLSLTAVHGVKSYSVITEYYILSRRIPTIGGIASVGIDGTPVSEADLIPLPPRDTRSVPPQEYYLGEIGTAEVSEVVNEGSLLATPRGYTVIFRAKRSGEEVIYLYEGLEAEVGTGAADTSETDFREFPTDDADLDPSPPPVFYLFKKYETIADMIADIGNQTPSDILFVVDASDDPDLDFTGIGKKHAYYRRNYDQADAQLASYLLISAPYASNGGGSTGIYQGASPTTRTVGGLSSGTAIAGKTYDEIFEAMLAEYVAPSISSFSMVGQSSPIEVGTVISGNKNFSFGFSQSGNVANNTIKIIDVTNGNNVLASGLPKSSPQSVNVGSVTKTTATDNVWRIEAESTKGATIARDMSIQWQYRYFFGGSATDITTSAQVRALATSGLDSGGTNNVNVTAGTAHTEFYFFVQNGRKIDAVMDTSALNADITSAYVLVGTITVNDNGGNPQTYKKYKLTLAAGYETPHVHRITIKNN